MTKSIEPPTNANKHHQTVADGIMTILATADTEREERHLMEVLASTSLVGLADMTSPDLVSRWLDDQSKAFAQMARKAKEGLH